MEGGPPLISAENSLLAQPVGPATLLFSWSPPLFFFFWHPQCAKELAPRSDFDLCWQQTPEKACLGESGGGT